jgi:hypothetical protein
MNENLKALVLQSKLDEMLTTELVGWDHVELEAFAKLLINGVIHEYKKCPPLLFPEYHIRKHFGVL